MPIYEYNCPTCGADFEKLVRGMSAEEHILCPACNSDKPRRKLSLVAAKGGNGEACGSCSSGGHSCAGCGSRH
jgi:putative FmdB family regulatory protein